jgi:hypothetical protein
MNPFELSDAETTQFDPAYLQFFKERDTGDALFAACVVGYEDDRNNETLIFLTKEQTTNLRDYLTQLLEETKDNG